jgi:hypothetical protein
MPLPPAPPGNGTLSLFLNLDIASHPEQARGGQPPLAHYDFIFKTYHYPPPSRNERNERIAYISNDNRLPLKGGENEAKRSREDTEAVG